MFHKYTNRFYICILSDSSDLANAQLVLYNMMRGPWDRQNHHKAFAVEVERPEGAGFYPDDVSHEAWDQFIEQHPEERGQLESLVTMVVGKTFKHMFLIKIFS